jgi:mycothiol system anti-sigma-R factor
MVCQDVLDRLLPFLDDELDPVASREVLQHLESCSSCSAAFARQRQLSESLRSSLEYHRAPDLLRARVLRETRASQGHDRAVPRRAGNPPWRWVNVAAALVVVVGGVWAIMTLPTLRANDAIAREVVSSHVRSLMTDHLADVASTDQHTVKPWFAGRLDFSPPVADFAAAGYPLVGGRLDYVHDRAVAALVYRRHQHVINVFVWPTADSRDEIAPAITRQGFHLIRGRHGAMAFWVVSDLNTDELARFARMLLAAGGSH